MEPNREQIRRRRAREHDALRDDLARLEAAAEQYRREGRWLLGPLRHQAETFRERLQEHMEWEDAQRPRREEEPARSGSEHRTQREQLDGVLEDLRSGARPPAIVAARLAALAGLLLRDFDEGERALDARGA